MVDVKNGAAFYEVCVVDKQKVDKEISMKVSVILGHPYEGSFNAAIAETVV